MKSVVVGTRRICLVVYKGSKVHTKPTKKRTATLPDFTTSYCIQVLRTAILRLKLFAVEKTPMKRSTGLWMGIGGDLSTSKSMTCSNSSDVGSPLARTDISLMSPEILTSLTSHGSKLWQDKEKDLESALALKNLQR